MNLEKKLIKQKTCKLMWKNFKLEKKLREKFCFVKIYYNRIEICFPNPITKLLSQNF